MPHCPTCQQHPGIWRTLRAGLGGERVYCWQCERSMVVPRWQQRRLRHGMVAALVLGAAAGVAAVRVMLIGPWWWGLAAGPALVPVWLYAWARWWSRTVRPEDLRMEKPPRRHSRSNRRRQKLM